VSSAPPFAIATREELWSRGRVLETRLTHGEATHHETYIEASDARDDELVEIAEDDLDALRAVTPLDARVRLVATARRVAGVVLRQTTLVIARGGLSLVSDREHALRDAELLRALDLAPETEVPDPRSLPLVWRNGSASVLLHEAAGHAAEHGHAALQWPEWLSLHDEPPFDVDDTGATPRVTDLLAGECPWSWRRESFRDVPLRRMSRLVARQHGAPFELPPRRIDVHLLSRGAYEPLTGMVSLFIAAADLVDGASARRLPPFALHVSRDEVARAIAGAEGEPLRYPGVICSSEGQELVVASYAPLLVTHFGRHRHSAAGER
jgi:hypothetical protein